MTKPELKAKIHELKALRLQVLESKEAKKPFGCGIRSVN